MISIQDILLRLFAALVLGAIIGLERESSEHAAGLRTNALVALGCALFTLVSAYGFLGFLSLPHIQVDPTRIASYIVAGIGFLGGGSIFLRHDRQRVKGLTTAAAIWVVAAIGVACGIGMIWEAVAVTVLALFVLVVLRSIQHVFKLRSDSGCRLQLEIGPEAKQIVSQIYEICSHNKITPHELEVNRGSGDGEIVKLGCHMHDTRSLAAVLDDLRALAGVRSVSADMHDHARVDPMDDD